MSIIYSSPYWGPLSLCHMGEHHYCGSLTLDTEQNIVHTKPMWPQLYGVFYDLFNSYAIVFRHSRRFNYQPHFYDRQSPHPLFHVAQYGDSIIGWELNLNETCLIGNESQTHCRESTTGWLRQGSSSIYVFTVNTVLWVERWPTAIYIRDTMRNTFIQKCIKFNLFQISFYYQNIAK